MPKKTKAQTLADAAMSAGQDARYKAYLALVQKARQGNGLSAADLSVMRQLEQEFGGGGPARRTRANDGTMATAEIVLFFGVAERTMRHWSSKGCPKEKYDRWNPKAVLDWWLENIYEGGGDGGQDIGAVKMAYWVAKTEREQIEVEKKKAALIPVDDVHTAWAERVSEVCAGLENLVFRLPGLLEGKPREDMAGIIRNEIRALRASYARDGAHTEGGAVDLV